MVASHAMLWPCPAIAVLLPDNVPKNINAFGVGVGDAMSSFSAQEGECDVRRLRPARHAATRHRRAATLESPRP